MVELAEEPLGSFLQPCQLVVDGLVRFAQMPADEVIGDLGLGRLLLLRDELLKQLIERDTLVSLEYFIGRTRHLQRRCCLFAIDEIADYDRARTLGVGQDRHGIM